MIRALPTPTELCTHSLHSLHSLSLNSHTHTHTHTLAPRLTLVAAANLPCATPLTPSRLPGLPRCGAPQHHITSLRAASHALPAALCTLPPTTPLTWALSCTDWMHQGALSIIRYFPFLRGKLRIQLSPRCGKHGQVRQQCLAVKRAACSHICRVRPGRWKRCPNRYSTALGLPCPCRTVSSTQTMLRLVSIVLPSPTQSALDVVSLLVVSSFVVRIYLLAAIEQRLQ